MTDQERRQLRNAVEALDEATGAAEPGIQLAMQMVRAGVERLLQEAYWHAQQGQRLEAENAALRLVAQAVTEIPNGQMHLAQGDWAVCPFACGAEDAGLLGWRTSRLRHTPECPVTKARALLEDTLSNA